jgi:predicted DNA binding protein
MSPVAEFSVPAESFELGRVLDVGNGGYCELYRIVPVDNDPAPYVWIRADAAAFDAMEERFLQNRWVETFSVVVEQEQDRLYRLEWTTIDELLQGLETHDLVVDRASSDGERWQFRVFTPEQSALRSFQRYCRTNDIPIDIERISETLPAPDLEAAELTAGQSEALRLARDEGYFEIPRETTLEELGEELGITRQALSDRLRRGTRNLIDQTLGETDTAPQ